MSHNIQDTKTKKEIELLQSEVIKLKAELKALKAIKVLKLVEGKQKMISLDK